MKQEFKFAVYWNDEYIGEADSLHFEKGDLGEMPICEIKGKLQIKRT